jgi:preprotein translocase subunit SecD
MRRNTIIFLAILVVFLLAAAVVFPISSQSGGLLLDRPIKLGLDLNGGVRLVYKADLTGVAPGDQKSALEADAAVIAARVDKIGATNPVINLLSGDRILVELPGMSDIQKAVDTIGKTDVLEFGEQTTDAAGAKWTAKDSTTWKPAVGTLNGKQVALTSKYFKNNTSLNTDPSGKLILAFEWTDEGSVLSKEITTRLLNKPLGIFSGSELLSRPTVNAVITESGIIEGLTQAEATDLRDQLNAGRLEVPLTIISNDQVDSSLGGSFVDMTFKAAIIGLILVMLFMIIYYRFPGLLASLALLFYALINLAIFKLVPVTMTLGGLAGFIASMGMAVDANVLIFERMKEELRAGRTVGAAIEAGFKRAWAAIWDCNVTTFIACIIMYLLGSNTVASSSLVTGFALTLFIGVAVSMFTAITVTRTLLRLFVGTSVAQKTGLFLTIGGK